MNWKCRLFGHKQPDKTCEYKAVYREASDEEKKELAEDYGKNIEYCSIGYIYKCKRCNKWIYYADEFPFIMIKMQEAFEKLFHNSPPLTYAYETCDDLKIFWKEKGD